MNAGVNNLKNNNYCKKYILNSKANSYIISLESLVKNKEQILHIFLSHSQTNEKMVFYTDKFLEEIKKEYNFLSEYQTIESLIDYFTKIIKQNLITIDRTNKLIYSLYFYDKNINKVIKLYLKRKIEMNEKIIEEIEEEILKLYKDYEKLKNDANKNESKDNQYIKDKNLDFILSFYSMNNIHKRSDSFENNIYKKLSIINELSFDIINNKFIINKSNFDFAQNIIFKKNDNIMYCSEELIEVKNKIIINNEKEECELFNGFNIENEHTIIIWTVKNRGNIINYKLDNKENKEKIAHNNKIDNLQYFHKENFSKNNDYILNSFGKLIKNFCLFNNKDYTKENSFIFIYYEKFIDFNNNFKSQKEKEIICYKLDNNLKLINWKNNQKNKVISSFDKINYIDTFFNRKENILYLINCQERNIKIIKNVLNDNYKGIYYNNNETEHLSAFIVERNNNIELFEINIKGIYIWDINNNLKPKSKIFYNNYFFYDICLWNNDFLCASTNLGFKFISINDKKIIKTIEKCANKTGSKIMKIYSIKEGYSLIGIDFKYNLSLYSIEVKKNN